MTVDAISASAILRPERRFLTRREATDYINALGLPMGRNQLTQLAWSGGGPLFSKFGGRAMYRVADIEAWLEEQMSGSVTNTSDQAGE